jgi:hypothetical protein
MKFVVLNLLLCFISTLLLFYIELSPPDDYVLISVLVVSWVGIVFNFRFFHDIEGRPITPFTCYILSICIFIVSRPLFSVFSDVTIIEIGLRISDLNISATLLFIMIVFYFMSIMVFFLKKPAIDILERLPSVNFESKIIMNLSLLFSFFLGFCFLYKSIQNFHLLGSSSNYFNFMGTLNTSYFRFFFFAKYFLIVYLFLSKSKDSLFVASLSLFIYSIGFILIGLRGYTIAYLFLFLIALNIKFKIKIIYIVVAAVSLLLISAEMLSYRLGFDVFENMSLFDTVIKTITQQGASFEVVFGSVNFTNEINNCIGYTDYFMGKAFGDCVDISRGVNFAEGGFASSFYAELYYFLPYGIIILPMFSFFLCFLQFCYINIVNVDVNGNVVKEKLFLFLLTPNIVYFGRSSLFDFTYKSITTIIFILTLIYIANFIKVRR